MACAPRDRDREGIELELETVEYQKLLLWLQDRQPFFRRFMNWADVLAFMRAGTSTDPRKDEILRPIFEAHAGDGDPRWRTILLAVFWPGLTSIHARKSHWDRDADERWQNIVWVFLRVVCRLDVKRRPNRLAQKLVNDTVHDLYEGYRRTWNRSKRELATDPEELEELGGAEDGISTARLELREIQDIRINRLQEHRDRGRIGETDFLLLVATRLYGRTLADYARVVGLDYEVAKKRRQRAESRILRFERDRT